MAIFFEHFSKFKGRAFHMAGESYGVSTALEMSYLKIDEQFGIRDDMSQPSRQPCMTKTEDLLMWV